LHLKPATPAKKRNTHILISATDGPYAKIAKMHAKELKIMLKAICYIQVVDNGAEDRWNISALKQRYVLLAVKKRILCLSIQKAYIVARPVIASVVMQ
jgi:hypothetical protein